MTTRSYINILTIAFCLTIALNSCGQFKNTKVDQVVNNKSAQIDTSKTAIIAFKKKSVYPFDNTFSPANLTQTDLHSIDSLLIACVTDYNNSLDNDHKEWGIDLKKRNYRKQLIAVTNEIGEKEVWVNCFCHTLYDNTWKTDIVIVDDGGNCFFNFKINLTTKKFYDLDVNGEA